MAGLVPAIHVLSGNVGARVDARDKPGHDGWRKPKPARPTDGPAALSSPAPRGTTEAAKYSAFFAQPHARWVTPPANPPYPLCLE